MNYCEMYFNIIVSSSVNGLNQFFYRSVSVEYVYESFIAILRRLPYYDDIILLTNNSERSRIVEAVTRFYSASPLHTVN